MSKELTTIPRKEKQTKRSLNWNKRSKTIARSPAFVTKRDIKGFRVNCSADPPAITACPWNQLTIQKTIVVGTTNVTGLIDATDIAHWIIEQTGIPFKGYFSTLKPTLCIRVREVRTWNMTGRSIGLIPYDYSNPSTSKQRELEEIGGFIDSGTSQRLPATGFHWPITTSGHTLTVVLKGEANSSGDDEGDGNRKICVIMGSTNDSLITHFHVDWRFPPRHSTGVDLESAFRIQQQIYSNTRELKRRVAESNKFLEKVYSSMPATIPTVFGQAALVVDENPLRLIPKDAAICEELSLQTESKVAAVCEETIIQSSECDLTKIKDDISRLTKVVSSLQSVTAVIDNDIESCSSNLSFVQLSGE